MSNILSNAPHEERLRREGMAKTLRTSPIPDQELLMNLGLYLNRQALSRILYIQELYQRILDVPGVIMEFGVRWGQNMALFHSFRGMYEPFNYSRKIIGFDTFDGFPDTDPKDGPKVAQGDYAVVENYDTYLEDMLKYHELQSPLSHIKKYEIIKGDACKTLDTYLEKHPETIISMAYFDFDLYKPTKECLKKIEPFLTKGSLVAFDELNCAYFAGETIALKEMWGLSRYPLKRSPHNPFCAYAIVT